MNLIGYPPFTEMFFHGGKGYEYRNLNSNKVFIILDGSSWTSAVGRHDGKSTPIALLSRVRDRYSIFAVEKFNREIGVNYFDSMEEREHYTIDNLLKNYYMVISEYISQNEFESIIILGHSEGAYILPLLYSRLNNPNIKALISSGGGGGLTFFESQKILLDKNITETDDFSTFNALDEKQREVILSAALLLLYETAPFPDFPIPAGGADNLEMTFRWFNSIMHLELYDYYREIDIPILFLHGKLDNVVAIETTQYIETNLPNKPFYFNYFDDIGHSLTTMLELLQWQRVITNWLIEIDL
ncbi:MAG: alpha/beta hydrolase [Treponema sp.]|nr:alpha/beta hydrolase [Treponema sp.]